MSEDISRRSLLYTASVLGSSAIAGCGSRGDGGGESSTAEGTATPAGGLVFDELALAELTLTEGETLRVTAQVENTAASSIEMEVPLEVGGRRLTTQPIEVGAGKTERVEFTATIETTGTQQVSFGREPVGEVVVRAAWPDRVRDIGAHYYPWYGAPIHDWRDGEWSLESPSTPVLGNYNSADPAVIEQHIDWCRQAGVSWLNVSWWGEYSRHDDRIREDILAHPRASELDWSILYETTGLLGSDPVQIHEEPHRQRFIDDVSYLADTYFSHDSYKHIDDRPVLYVWVGQNLRGDVTATYEAAVEAAGVRPYLITDIIPYSGINTHPIAEAADAVTTYLPYDADGESAAEFTDGLESMYRSWYRAGEYAGVDLVPTAIPGFDDTELTHDPRNNTPLEPTPELYEATGEIARKYADGPVLVTSFNEWYEDTEIEPGEDHGEAYLDVTAETLASAPCEPPAFDGDIFTLTFERLVPESEMNPDVERGRKLSFMLYGLTVRGAGGETVLDTDVGSNTETGEFLLGAYGREGSRDDSWRWLGGERETVVQVPTLPATGTIEITGMAAAEMNVALSVDDKSVAETTVTTQMDTHALSFE